MQDRPPGGGGRRAVPTDGALAGARAAPLSHAPRPARPPDRGPGDAEMDAHRHAIFPLLSNKMAFPLPRLPSPPAVPTPIRKVTESLQDESLNSRKAIIVNERKTGNI